MTLNPNSIAIVAAAGGYFGAPHILPPGTKGTDAMIVRGAAALALYFIAKKYAAAHAPAAPVNGLGYMPNTTLSYGPIHGLGFSLSKPKITALKKLSPGQRLLAEKNKKLKSKKSKKLKAAKAKSLKSRGAKLTVAQIFGTMTLAQLMALKSRKMITPAAYAKGRAFIVKRDALTASGTPIATAITTAAPAYTGSPDNIVYMSSDGDVSAQGDTSSGSGQSFADPNISYSADSDDSADPTERFDDTPTGTQDQNADVAPAQADTPAADDSADDSADDDSSAPAGKGKGMAIAAAAAGAWWLFGRH